MNALDLVDRYRKIHREMGDALWAYDSAESMLRKAQPSTGYRSTAALGDAPWDAGLYRRDRAAAVLRIARGLRALHALDNATTEGEADAALDLLRAD